MKNEFKGIIIALITLGIMLAATFAAFQMTKDVNKNRTKTVESKIEKEQEAINDPYIEITVENTLFKNSGLFQEAYDDLLTKVPNANSGLIIFTWVIAPNGKVIENKLRTSDFFSPYFEDKLEKLIFMIRFPPHPAGKETRVSHKFEFTNPNNPIPFKKTN